jgi:F-type H+-transporting ATPase subunit delta
MQGSSRAALKAVLARFEERVASLPDAAGSGEVSRGLYAVAGLLDREPSLRRALVDPASSPESRRGLVQQLLGGQLSELPLQVLSDLVAERWDGPADLAQGVEQVAATAALVGAEGEGSLDDVEDELFRFSRLLEREPALRAALTDPGLPDDRKAGLVRELLGSRARPTTAQLVEVAVLRTRGRSLEARLSDLVELAATRRSRYVAEVRVALPLAEDQAARLADVLGRIYGREVQLQVDVDPSVLGGIEVRVGDEVIDGTVARNLNDVRRTLAGS